MALSLTVTKLWFSVKSSSVSTQYNAVKCSLSEHCAKDWAAKKVTIFKSTVHLVKTSEFFYFFICILPDYVADDITKEF